MYDVSVVGCKSYDPADVRAALIAALEPIGGLDFIKKGDRVAIKANLVSPKKADAAATTHPQMIASLCELLCERGADVVVGDSPGGLYNKTALQRTYSACGLDAAERAGARLNDDFSHVNVSFPDAKKAKEFSYTGYLQNADYIIDFCKLKTHGMVGLSCAVKNMFGCVPGTNKPEYHYRFPGEADFSDMLIDLNEYAKPVLSIVDAVVGMEGNGPTNGTPRFVGAVIAATKPYYADLAAAEIIPFRTLPPTLAAAAKRGLAPESINDLHVFGSPKSFFVADYKTVDCAKLDFSSIHPHIIAQLADAVFAQRPKLVPAKCVGCGKCRTICPAKAITMKDDKPHIDRSKCIRCFCCQEFCPKGALAVHRTAVARIINR